MFNSLQQFVSNILQASVGADGTLEAGKSLVTLPSGQLYTKSPLSRCIFQDAQMSIQSTGKPFTTQLVVTKVYGDGEEDLDDDREEDDDEICLLIDASIGFKRLPKPGFSWTDPSDGNLYEFHVDGKSINKHTLDFFETSVLECMFERRYNKSRALATNDDLDVFRNLTVNDSITSPVASKSPVKAERPALAQKPTGDVVLSIVSDIYVYDATAATFVKWIEENVVVEIVQVEKFQFWLAVMAKSSGSCLITQLVDDDMNPFFSDQHRSFIWNYNDGSKKRIFSFSIVFRSGSYEKLFRDKFGRCFYENKNQTDISQLKEDDVNFVLRAFNDVEMEDVSSQGEEYSDESENEVDEVDENYQRVDTGDFGSSKRSPEKNSQLAVGYKTERSFVTRGDRIGVFKHDENDHLSYVGLIDGMKTPKGKSIAPSKVMLHNQDSSMVLLDPEKQSHLYRMDLEYGKIVDEWEVDENRQVVDFTHDTKYGQMTPQQTFVGISHNALFRIDPRQSGKKLVDSQLNQYKSKNQFSCAATTGKGDVVVASDKGDLRLYNQIEKRAKTHLPGLGDAIVGVDVSEDGKFILATTKTYILVIDTEAENTSGFQKSLGSNKPAPKRLQLKPEHVAWMNIPISFTAARFNTGTNESEKTIVTSTGPYVITWNFRRVKNSHLYDYNIRKYPEKVVADNFRFGSDKNVIVTLPDDVTMASKKDFMTPQKMFGSPMGTPKSKSIRNRDIVVNSPF